ncbi:MAG: glycosyltransferase [Acidobacteriota bacterium]|nr:glycosyltransferase [Acidobacteriota bacterium]
MTERPLRVALFPDSLHEVNGVANTCRNFVAYAQRQNLPMLVVSAAPETATTQDGSVTRMGLRRGPFSFALEKDLRFDAAILRYRRQVIAALKLFRPDVVHITGPNDIGMLGAFVAHEMGIPVAASWHTNVHEYAARRADRILPRLLAGKARARTLQTIEDVSFHLSALFYRVGRFHYAPNQELIAKLEKATHKPCSLMERGVDLEMFSPAHRDRQKDGRFVIGYAGRLSTEKKVRSFAALAQTVRAAGLNKVKFVFVGHGQEETWLRQHVPGAEFTGVLRGQALARAYANMDLFAFFSETDTFGNVVLEALASGVPAVVTDKGGPKFIVEHQRCGFVCADDFEFFAAVLRLATDSALHGQCAVAARERAQRASWDAVFASVYDAYRRELPRPGEVSKPSRFRRTMNLLSRAQA